MKEMGATDNPGAWRGNCRGRYKISRDIFQTPYQEKGPRPDTRESPENIRNEIRDRPDALAPAKRRVQHHPDVLIQLPDMRLDADQIACRVAGELSEHAQPRAAQHA